MPFLKKLRTTLTRGLPPPPDPRSRLPTSEELEKLKKAERALMRVIVPGYDVDLVSGGVVKKIRLTNAGDIVVFLDYTGSDPHCNFCRFINWQLWKKILTQAEQELLKEGLNNPTFVDWATGAVIEYKKNES